MDRIIAQVHPAVKRYRHPQSVEGHPEADGRGDEGLAGTTWSDGPTPPIDIGPPGMYASFEWSDLEAIGSWVGLGADGDKSGEDGRASAWGDAGGRRDGWGFGR